MSRAVSCLVQTHADCPELVFICIRLARGAAQALLAANSCTGAGGPANDSRSKALGESSADPAPAFPYYSGATVWAASARMRAHT